MNDVGTTRFKRMAIFRAGTRQNAFASEPFRGHYVEG